ncbi:MAG: hypothetical protein GX975_03425 [Clostridiales bacterium]|nr:hypothetical protein [Clostridiales bacterium]
MRFVSVFLVLLWVVLIFTGCMGRDKFTEEQENSIVEQGKPLLDEFLASLPAESIEVKGYYMKEAAPLGAPIYAGRLPSNVASVSFAADGERYEAIVDLQSGKLYSNYYIFDINPHIERQLKPYCERYGFDGDFSVRWARVGFTIYSKDVDADGDSKNTATSYTDIWDMIPAECNQEDEIERADAFLKDAPISGFEIEYSIQNDDFFDPRILADYLAESGNYKGAQSWEEGIKNYSIYGRKHYDKFPERGIYDWKIDLSFEGDIETMPYSIERSDCYKEREFCFIYTAAAKAGYINEYETDELKEFELPLTIEEGKFIYRICEGAKPVYLSFEEKPPYTFNRTCYEIDSRNVVHEETENLILVQNKDGLWYLGPESAPDAYRYYYIFEQDQDLEFR